MFKFLGKPGSSTAQEGDSEKLRAALDLLYSTGHELTSALELKTILQRVLSLALRNTGGNSGSVMVLDDNGLPVDSAILYGSEVHSHATRQLRVTLERGLAGWVATNKQAVLIPDTSKDERWLRRADDAEDRTGPKSVISAPLLARDRVVGVITLVHPKTGYFNEENLALLQGIADQAGSAVLNARLYAESQRRARVMTALAESAAVITASLNLEEVLQRILEQTTLALRVETVALALVDPRKEDLLFRAASGKAEQGYPGLRLPIGQGIAGWVAKEGRGVIIPDVRQDARFSAEGVPLKEGETRALACAPIRSRGQVIGVLEVMNSLEKGFDADALVVLTGIGSLAGSAIRHAQLFERLQSAHERYLELFEDSIDPILIAEPEGRIIEANRQAEVFTGCKKDALRRMTIQQLMVGTKTLTGEQAFNLDSGKTATYDSLLHTTAGMDIPVQVHARQVLIDELPHVQWILHDLTERKRLDTLRNDLISMIYHDLRSPLNNVISSLDVLQAMLTQEGDPTQQSLINIAIRSTERIQRLTDSLLDIRRMEAGQPLGQRQMASIQVLALEAVEAVAPFIENKRQVINHQLPSGLPEIWIDPDMIRRVLVNLMENALKYTPVGSQITIGASLKSAPGVSVSSRPEESIEVFVQDNGPGIPESEHSRIFEKFSRLNMKEGPKGLGLGLAFCKLAVEAHGGRIWLESLSGEGATFHFSLPITPPSITSSQEQASSGQSAPPSTAHHPNENVSY